MAVRKRYTHMRALLDGSTLSLLCTVSKWHCYENTCNAAIGSPVERNEQAKRVPRVTNGVSDTTERTYRR
jgi:hypothetical protein